MKNYKSKAVELEALQFDGTNGEEILTWVVANGGAGRYIEPQIATRESPYGIAPELVIQNEVVYFNDYVGFNKKEGVFVVWADKDFEGAFESSLEGQIEDSDSVFNEDTLAKVRSTLIDSLWSETGGDGHTDMGAAVIVDSLISGLLNAGILFRERKPSDEIIVENPIEEVAEPEIVEIGYVADIDGNNYEEIKQLLTGRGFQVALHYDLDKNEHGIAVWRDNEAGTEDFGYIRPWDTIRVGADTMEFVEPEVEVAEIKALDENRVNNAITVEKGVVLIHDGGNISWDGIRRALRNNDVDFAEVLENNEVPYLKVFENELPGFDWKVGGYVVTGRGWAFEMTEAEAKEYQERLDAGDYS